MLGFKPGKRGKDKKPAHIKREGNNFAGGGAISGPGTGISDDISTEVPEGTYIMPADSTEAIGEQVLAGMGTPVPVNVSNGEYEMPPEQVHAVGAQVLDQMKNATHTPTGKPPSSGPEIFFADGGLVEDPRRISQSRALVPVQQPTQQAAPQPQGRPDFYTNSRGETARGYAPSASRAVVPAGPVTTPGQLVPAGGPQPSAGPSAQPREPNYRARAEAMGRAKADTAAYEAHRASQDARFADAAKGGTPNADSRVRGFLKNPWVTRLAAPLSVGMAVNDGRDEDSTARYAQRFAMDEPTGDGSVGDIGRFATLRGLGFASDLGATLDPTGLVRRSYRDTEPTETGPLEQAGAGAGALAGFSSGGRRMLGRGLDNTAQAVSRGRYRGDVAERMLAPKGKKADLAAGVVGAVAGSQAMGAAGAAADDALGLRDQAVPATVQPSTVAPSAVAPSADATGVEGVVGNQAELTNNVIRDGNRFYANGPITEGFTVNGQRPETMVNTVRSPQNEAAVQALFARTPELGAGQGGQQAARGFSAGGPNVTILRDTSRPLTAREIFSMRQDERRENAERAQQSESERLRLDERRLAGQEIAQGFQVRAAQRLERLSEMYESAETPEERAAIAEQIAHLNGTRRNENLRNNYITLGGGQEWDEQAGMMVNRPQQLFDIQNQQVINPGAQGGQRAPQPGEQRGGYRFKGGNPADQNNWEKI